MESPRSRKSPPVNDQWRTSAPAPAHGDDDTARRRAVRIALKRRENRPHRSGRGVTASRPLPTTKIERSYNRRARKGGEGRERLFIGVPLTEEARRGIEKSLPKKLPGKVVPIENWHFTLRFLGSTAPDVRDQIIQRLKFAGCGAAFTIRFSELGAFPGAGRARVLWLGIDEGVERMTARRDRRGGGEDRRVRRRDAGIYTPPYTESHRSADFSENVANEQGRIRREYDGQLSHSLPQQAWWRPGEIRGGREVRITGIGST